jgi:hypothetical protein
MMRKPSIRLPGVVVLALTLLALSATPAAAAKVSGEGYHARFGLGSGNGGLVVVDKVDADSGRVRALVAGLIGSQEYFVVGRSIGCNGTPSQSNRVFGLTTETNGHGRLWVDRSVVLKEVLISSIWIGRTGGNAAPMCRKSTNFAVFVATGDVNGDGAVGIIDGTSNTMMGLVEKRPNGHARVSIVVDPSDPTGDIYSVTLANRACGRTPTKTFMLDVEGAAAGFGIHDIHMNQGSLNGLRSIRLRNVSNGINMGCAPLSLMALLLP